MSSSPPSSSSSSSSLPSSSSNTTAHITHPNSNTNIENTNEKRAATNTTSPIKYFPKSFLNAKEDYEKQKALYEKKYALKEYSEREALFFTTASISPAEFTKNLPPRPKLAELHRDEYKHFKEKQLYKDHPLSPYQHGNASRLTYYYLLRSRQLRERQLSPEQRRNPIIKKSLDSVFSTEIQEEVLSLQPLAVKVAAERDEQESLAGEIDLDSLSTQYSALSPNPNSNESQAMPNDSERVEEQFPGEFASEADPIAIGSDETKQESFEDDIEQPEPWALDSTAYMAVLNKYYKEPVASHWDWKKKKIASKPAFLSVVEQLMPPPAPIDEPDVDELSEEVEAELPPKEEGPALLTAADRAEAEQEYNREAEELRAEQQEAENEAQQEVTPEKLDPHWIFLGRHIRIEEEPLPMFFKRERNSLCAYVKPFDMNNTSEEALEEEEEKAHDRLMRRLSRCSIDAEYEMRGAHLKGDVRHIVRSQRIQAKKRKQVQQQRHHRLMFLLKYILYQKNRSLTTSLHP